MALLVSFSPSSNAIWWNWRGVNGQGMALKLLVAAGLAWFLPQNRDRVNYWHPNFLLGIVLGSIGLFFIKALHIRGMVHWPFQFLGSSIPELGSLFWQTSQLSPLFASCLVPLALMSLLGSHPHFKWLALGVSVGVTSFLFVSLFSAPSVMWFGRSGWSELYLLVNAIICAISTRLFFTVATEP
ncbi:MAG: DUF5942 domain-containing protein [Cyanobacteria bacterium J06650_10]